MFPQNNSSRKELSESDDANTLEWLENICRETFWQDKNNNISVNINNVSNIIKYSRRQLQEDGFIDETWSRLRDIGHGTM